MKTLYGYGYAFIAGGTQTDRATRPRGSVVYFLQHVSRDSPLFEGENVIGRDPGCAVVIEAPDVSRYHARITIAESTATIEDLGSKNGTFVDGSRVVGKAPLAAGNKIVLGETPLSFHGRDALQSTRSASSRKRPR